jgi:hypothetical protein
MLCGAKSVAKLEVSLGVRLFSAASREFLQQWPDITT